MSERIRLSKKQRLAVLAAAGGVCTGCGLPIEPGDRFDIDHQIPLALGGEDGGKNLVPLHPACHARKTPGDITRIAKAKRVKAKHEGTFRPPRAVVAGSKASRFKKCLSGAVLDRKTGRIVKPPFQRRTP